MGGADYESRELNLLKNTELQKVEKEGGKVVKTVQRAELDADYFVFALGAWSSKWSDALECSIPIEPGKGYSLTMKTDRWFTVTSDAFSGEKNWGISL